MHVKAPHAAITAAPEHDGARSTPSKVQRSSSVSAGVGGSVGATGGVERTIGRKEEGGGGEEEEEKKNKDEEGVEGGGRGEVGASSSPQAVEEDDDLVAGVDVRDMQTAEKEATPTAGAGVTTPAGVATVVVGAAAAAAAAAAGDSCEGFRRNIRGGGRKEQEEEEGEEEWLIFNDFLVERTVLDDARGFGPAWKEPCVLVYRRVPPEGEGGRAEAAAAAARREMNKRLAIPATVFDIASLAKVCACFERAVSG